MIDDFLKLKSKLVRERETQTVLSEIDVENSEAHKLHVAKVNAQIKELDASLLKAAEVINNAERLRIFGLKYIQGLTNYSIARKVGLSERAVQRQVKKALETIRTAEK